MESGDVIKFAWIIYGTLLTEQLSIISLAAVLKKKGIDSLLFYSSSEKELMHKINQTKPDIIAYSLMYGSHWPYIELAKQIRHHHPHIFQLAGGPLTTFHPQALDELCLDAIALGEADVSLVEFVAKYSQNDPSFEDTKGFYFRKNVNVKRNELHELVNNLSDLPFPDRDILYNQDDLLRNQEFKSFLSGRGCPYPCTYCFNHQFNEMFRGKGKIVRKKSVDYFIEEINETRARYGCQFAIFEDDIFVINKSWLEEFASKYPKRVGVPYICYTRANFIDEDVVKLLKESGCHIVRMAIETGNQNLRNNLLKRNMTNGDIIKASDLIHRHGLKLSVSNMVGIPTETIEALNDTIKLNIRCRPDHPTIQFFMSYPGMELTRIAIEKGHFHNALFKQIPKNTWRYTPLRFDQKTKRTFEKTQKIFSLIVRHPSIRRFEKLLFCCRITCFIYCPLPLRSPS